MCAAATVESGSLWIPVIAALGASVLTGVFTFGIEAWRRRQDARAERNRLLGVAASQMARDSAPFVQLASSLRLTMEVRSGLSEGLSVVTRLRAPMDPLEIHDRLAGAIAPLVDAQSTIWLHGDQQLVEAANQLVLRCTDVLGLAVAPDSGAARLTLRRVAWSDAQDQLVQDAIAAVAAARTALVRYVRDSEIDLLAGD